MKWSPTDLRDFIQVNYKTAPNNFLRQRVRKGLPLLAEYASAYIAQHYFDDVMP